MVRPSGQIRSEILTIGVLPMVSLILLRGGPNPLPLLVMVMITDELLFVDVSLILTAVVDLIDLMKDKVYPSLHVSLFWWVVISGSFIGRMVKYGGDDGMASGWSLNVSNFHSTSEAVTLYGPGLCVKWLNAP